MKTTNKPLRERLFPATLAPPAQRQGHLPVLDGVRGLAVLLVLCYDCLHLPADGSLFSLLPRKISAVGWTGVDLFFVLSGFLITGILLDTAGRRHYWKSFLVRRAVRIFPLYYGTLAVLFLLLPLLTALGVMTYPELLQQVRHDQFWYWTYTENWLYAWRGAWPSERVLNHFWSLAVEEQFYLFWPFVVAALSRKHLAQLCWSLCGFCLLLRWGLLSQGAAPVTTYVMLFTRLDSLCAGALLAIGLRTPGWTERWLPKAWPAFLALAATVAVGATISPLLDSEAFLAYSLGHTVVAALFTLLIGTLLALPAAHLFSRLFRFRGLLILGKYSYAIYVFHRLVYTGVAGFDWSFCPEVLRAWAIFGTTLLAVTLLARLSWICWESPFLSLKKYAPRPDLQSREATMIEQASGKPTESLDTSNRPPTEKSQPTPLSV